ncbi:MAG TPA: TAXI family TRAP transporter solute-binding subunit [Vicinamibacterales bacterium]|nr:TAXI family TRAP transporter solute-binding subunit [Vicinamibacterales bacterium]
MTGRVLLVLLLSAAAACGGSSETARPATRFLSIGTGGTGGVYYPYGGAIARVVTAGIPGVQVTAEVTAASVDNLKLMQLGKVDLALTTADTLAEAQAGTGPFAASSIGSIRTVATLYTNFTHVVVLRSAGFRTVADLKGKIVSVGAPGSGTELIADRVLEAAGLDPRKDIVRHSLGVSESAGAMKDGKLDAFIWSGGVPTPAVQDLAATPGMTIALLPQADLLPALEQKYTRQIYRMAFLPPGAYRGVDAEIPVVGVTNFLVASSQLDEPLVYDIVRILFAQQAALIAAHPEARHLAVPTGPDVSPAPFHPGAIRYYKEHGW